ncbi:MAG: dockerin type I repeat-containing protein [Clostridia bacterium]|nr:dockerin type I repeat-containing protein [Clostridia bacterium]
MKRTICVLLCLVMLFTCVQFSAVALSEEQLPDHTAVDYSQVLELGKTEALPLDNDAPLIRVEFCSWRGYAQGFTVELEAGKYYTFEVTITDVDGGCGYFDRALAVMRDDLSGDFELDYIVYANDNNSADDADSLTVKVSFVASESGDYKLLAWGLVEDSAGEPVFGTDNVKIEYSVYENNCAVVGIETASDLARFSEDVDNYYYDENMIVLNFKNDIDMSGIAYKPFDSYFIGSVVIRGNGNTVSGLTVPLIDEADGISVYDLDIESVIRYDEDSSSRCDVGMIACYANSFYIENSSLNGSISLSNNSDVENVGGIIGEAYAFEAYNVVANVDIAFNNVDNVAYVGGIIGYGVGKFNAFSVVWNGTITVDVKESACDIAGFAGLIEVGTAIIEHTSTSGEIVISEPITDIDTIGGFIGANRANTIYDNCVSCVDITALGAKYVGGFIARSEKNAVFFNCCYEGVIIGGSNTGGFVGISGSEASESSYVNCYAVSDIYAGEEVGGFIANAYGGESFINCYANGSYTDMRGNDNIPYGIGSFLGVADGAVFFANAFARGNNASSAYGDYPVDIDAEDATFVTVIDFKSSDDVSDMTAALNVLVGEINDADIYEYPLNTWYPRRGNGPSFTPAPQYRLGDVNYDGYVNQYDYILVKRHYFGTRTLSDIEMLPADANVDDKVDQFDYILICRHYFGTYTIG